MAGAGYKLFNTGDVLTAQQVNEYLQQQTVMVFANSTARTTALSGVLAEGMMSYLQDTNSVEVYNGSAWVSVSSDQIPLTTKGDLLTYSTTDTRLGVGANGTVLTANSSTATGLEWATPSSGGFTLLTTTTLSSTTTTVSSINQSYKHLFIRVYDAVFATGGQQLRFRPNGSSNAYFLDTSSASASGTQRQGTDIYSPYSVDNTGGGSNFEILIYNYTSSQRKTFIYSGIWLTSGSYNGGGFCGGIGSGSAITSFSVVANNNYAFSGGSIQIYGVN